MSWTLAAIIGALLLAMWFFFWWRNNAYSVSERAKREAGDSPIDDIEP